MLEMHERNGALTLAVRVQPRARRDEITGEWAGALKIRLQAPPVDDKANEALISFLAGVLRIPKSAVRILAGERGRIKRVEIRGVTAKQVEALLVHDA
jgi:uncharacterized protein (TIGR00251 family)